MRAPFRSRWRPWLAAALLLLTPQAWSQVQAPADLPALPPMRALPSLGDGGEMTLGEERRIGDQIARSIYRDPDYLDDPLLAAYLQQVWRPLLDSAQARGELPPDADQRYASPVGSVVGVVALPPEARDDLRSERRAILAWRGHTVPVVSLPAIARSAAEFGLVSIAVFSDSALMKSCVTPSLRACMTARSNSRLP